MNWQKKLILSYSLLLSLSVVAQHNSNAAEEKKKEAVQLMDNGNPDAAIALLDEALKLDPDNPAIIYEKAAAFYIKQDYKAARKILRGLLKRDDPGSGYTSYWGIVKICSGIPKMPLIPMKMV
ncbi:tetratricopeptide repeat protein [Chitinophaga sp. 212800010-3]|uniref:tetratricopeptide repeat protein n=1 Tax=unclassified Chitinophaga TaxID=2619133 RepID=UPI002DEF57F2|nr:hypothetical protein [Chitinophaga sp. 212800010-3]